MAKKRKHVCEAGFGSKRDALAEAAILRKVGFKTTVKASGAGFKVCRTYRKR